MKRLIIICICLLMLCGCEIPVYKAESTFEAAKYVGSQMETGEEKSYIWTNNDIDGQEMYKTLECFYPYVFSMEMKSYQVGLSETKIIFSNAAREQQAWLYAKKLAEQETKGMDNKKEQMLVLHDLIIRNCQYDIETAEKEQLDGTDNAFSAYGALIDGKAVCAGYARAYMMLCKAVGIDAYYISDSEMNHSWNAVVIDDEIYYIDCTFDDPIPDGGDKVLREYFLKTGDELKKTHTWDEDFYSRIIRENALK